MSRRVAFTLSMHPTARYGWHLNLVHRRSSRISNALDQTITCPGRIIHARSGHEATDRAQQQPDHYVVGWIDSCHSDETHVIHQHDDHVGSLRAHCGAQHKNGKETEDIHLDAKSKSRDIF